MFLSPTMDINPPDAAIFEKHVTRLTLFVEYVLCLWDTSE